MNVPRKVFLLTTVLLVIGTMAGIVIMTIMEYQARAALPSEEQTAQAIESLYDGAVCLACDFGRVFFAMFGSVLVIALLLAWGVYEVGLLILIRLSTPK